MFKLKNGGLLSRMKAAVLANPAEMIFRGCMTLVIILFTVWIVYSITHPPQPLVFPVPADVCQVDGAPRLISQNTGDLSQTYLRIDGATVKQTYVYGFGGTLKERSAEIWFDGTCPPAPREDE